MATILASKMAVVQIVGKMVGYTGAGCYGFLFSDIHNINISQVNIVHIYMPPMTVQLH